MLATMERVEILIEADHIVKMINESDVVEQYRLHLYKLQNNIDTQQKIKNFTKMKDMYEEVQRFGKYHPDYKRVMSEVREVKREMDLDENVINFKKSENALQSLLDEISTLIGHAVSKNIKVPTGNPFFDQLGGCGGSCGSGGGCGCS